MNLRQIEALRAVIESGTASRAAERLSISQPAVCAMVARGLGLAVVHPLYIGEFAPRVQTRPFGPLIADEIRILLPRHRGTSLVADAFVQAARGYVAALDG